MIKHLPFNDFDLAGVTNAVTHYKNAGLRADYSVAQKDVGIVRIVFENPVSRDGSLVVYDVHKVAKPGWFGSKAHWVIQLSSKEPGASARRRGCVAGKTQAQVFTAAELDLKHGFLSVGSFELMAQAKARE